MISALSLYHSLLARSGATAADVLLLGLCVAPLSLYWPDALLPALPPLVLLPLLLWSASRVAAPLPAPLGVGRLHWPLFAALGLGCVYVLPFLGGRGGLLVRAPLAEAFAAVEDPSWSAAVLSARPNETAMWLLCVTATLMAALVTRDRFRARGDRGRIFAALVLAPGAALLLAAGLKLVGAAQTSLQGDTPGLVVLAGAAGVLSLGRVFSRGDEHSGSVSPDVPWEERLGAGLVGLGLLAGALWLSLGDGPMLAALAAGVGVVVLGALARRSDVAAAGGVLTLGALVLWEGLRINLSAAAGVWRGARRMGPGVAASAPDGQEILSGLHGWLIDGGWELAIILLLAIGAVAVEALLRRPWRRGEVPVVLGLIGALTTLGVWAVASPHSAGPGIGLWAGAASALLLGPAERIHFEPALVWGRPPARVVWVVPALACAMLLGVAPWWGDLEWGRGLVARDAMALDDAMAAFNRASWLRPLDARPHLGAGGAALSWMATGALDASPANVDTAQHHLLQALARDPLDGRAQIGLAQVALLRGHTEAAIAWVSVAVALRPDDVVARQAQLKALGAAGRLEELALAWPRAARAVPEAQLGLVTEAALAAAEAGGGSCLDLRAAGAPWGARLSLCQAAAGQVGSAQMEVLLRWAAEAAPPSGAQARQLVELAMAQGAWPVALDVAERAQARYPDAWPLAVSLAQALTQQGRAAEALALLEAVPASTRGPEVALARLDGLIATGQLDKAQAVLAPLLEAMPRDVELMRRAVALAREGPAPARVEALERLLGVLPEELAALKELAKVYAQMGLDVRAQRLVDRCAAVAGDPNLCSTDGAGAPP